MATVDFDEVIKSIKENMTGRLNFDEVMTKILKKARTMRHSSKHQPGLARLTGTGSSNGSSASTSGGGTAPEPNKAHAKDVYIGSLDIGQLHNLWNYANSEFYIKQVHDKIIQDAIGHYDIDLMAFIPTSFAGDERELEVPTILNAPVVVRQRAELMSNIARSLLTVGYAVLAIKNKFAKHSLGDILFTAPRRSESSAPEQSTNTKKRKRGDVLSAKRDIDMKSVLPCAFVNPTEGVLEGYKCAVNGRDEWRFVPNGASSLALQEMGYRFAVFMPRTTFAHLAPQLPHGAKGTASIRTPLPGLYDAYVDVMLQKALYNQVLSFNAFPVDVCEVELPRQDLENMTDMQQLAQAQAANARARKCVNLEALGGGSPYALRNYQLEGSETMLPASTWRVLDRAFGESQKHMQNAAPRTLTNSHLSSTELHLAKMMGSKEPTPLDAAMPSGKKLEGVNYEWLKARQAQTFNIGTAAPDTFEASVAVLPPHIRLKQHIPAAYVGSDPHTNENRYLEKVLSAYRLTPLLMGLGGGRASSSGNSGTGKSTQESAVAQEKALYAEVITSVQDETRNVMHWIYTECVAALDGLALVDVFEQEARAAGAQHATILRCIEEYEHSFLAKPLDEGTEDGKEAAMKLAEQRQPDNEDGNDKEGAPPPTKKRKTLTEIIPTAEQEKFMDPAHVHLLSKQELTNILRDKFRLSFDQYIRAVQWLWFLTICIHGDVQLSIEFTKKASPGAGTPAPV